MKRVHKAASPSLLLLLVLILTAYGGPQPVKAEPVTDEGTNFLKIGSFPIPPATMCIGNKFDFDYFFQLWFGSRAPFPFPVSIAIVNISAQKGKIDNPHQKFPTILQGITYRGNFSYQAMKEGDETILLTVSIGKFTNKLDPPLKFKVINCEATVQWNHTTTLAYQMVSIVNTYNGTGTLSVNKDGQVSGNGSQAIWSYINPYSDEGGSCTHNAPWDSGSGISFNGQFGDAGEPSVNMELEALSINSTSLTCTGEDSSGTMAFPEYTFGACQILLAGFNFEAGTQDFQFDCPGEAPYIVKITVTPRSKK